VRSRLAWALCLRDAVPASAAQNEQTAHDEQADYRRALHGVPSIGGSDLFDLPNHAG